MPKKMIVIRYRGNNGGFSGPEMIKADAIRLEDGQMLAYLDGNCILRFDLWRIVELTIE